MTQPPPQDGPARPLLLVAFMQASNCSNYTGSWRHPETAPDFLDLAYYQDIAATLEAACFHLAFLDDRLAMPSRYGDSFRPAVEHGVRAVKLDLAPVITAMGLATARLGLGATYSTTYYPPYHVARLFGSLDHFTQGRIAWNVVTSLNDTEAQNFGAAEHPAHDDRYDAADEFMEAAGALWDSWGAGAVLADRAAGRFADAAQVRPADYAGRHFQARGPLTVPRSPQGRPVIIQAGQSDRGRRFAARWGELLFVIYPTPEQCRAYRDDLRARAVAAGRSADAVKVAPAVYVIVAETEAAAREKRQFIESLAHPVDSLALLSEVFNYDFAAHPPDEPLSDETLAAMSGLRGFLQRVIEQSGRRNPSVNDFIRWSGRGTLAELPVFCGTPAQVADGMAAWHSAGACDGFVLAATHMPGSYRDFAELVVPELQRRGLFRTAYAPGTLRQNLGLPAPDG